MNCCAPSDAARSKVKTVTRRNFKHVQDGGGDKEDGPSIEEIWAALEAACSELGYSLDQLNEILQPGREYPKELLNLILSKTGSQDTGHIIAMLDVQRVQFLGKVWLISMIVSCL
jgi:hypothetical protein